MKYQYDVSHTKKAPVQSDQSLCLRTFAILILRPLRAAADGVYRGLCHTHYLKTGVSGQFFGQKTAPNCSNIVQNYPQNCPTLGVCHAVDRRTDTKHREVVCLALTGPDAHSRVHGHLRHLSPVSDDTYPMIRNSVSGPEVGLPGRISGAF